MNAWRKVLLGSVVTFQRGYDLPYRDRRHGSFPVVTSAGITDFHFKPMVDPPGVVTGRYGTIGGLFFIDQPFWPLNTTLYVRDFHGNDPRFTYFLLQQFDFESFSGKSGVPGVNRNDLHKEPVWIPQSVAEQKEIANALSDVELLLNELSLSMEKKRQIKQATMQELLTGKRRLPGFEGEWEEVQLGDIAAIRNVKAVTSSMPAETQCVELECIEQGSGRLLMSNQPSGETTKYTFKKGDVLFGRLRAYLRKFWFASFDGIYSTEIWPLIARDERLSASFLHLLVQTNEFIDDACISYETHMPRSDWAVLRKFQMKLPPRPEQDAIATVIADIDAELSDLVQRSQKAACIKQGMMQQLLTGKIRLT